MTELLIFISAVGIVFFLGLQSLSVNSGHKILAAVNSLVIGSFNLFLLKSLPAGPVATHYNDWNEVVEACGNQAYYGAQRRRKHVTEECGK